MNSKMCIVQMLILMVVFHSTNEIGPKQISSVYGKEYEISKRDIESIINKESWEYMEDDVDYGNIDPAIDDENISPAEVSDEIDQQQQQQLPEPEYFDEAKLLSRWKTHVFVDRICAKSFMTAFVPRSLFGSSDDGGGGENLNTVLVLRSCCLNHRLQMNRTHLIFNFSFDEFFEYASNSDGDKILQQRDGAGACTDLRLFRYEVGVAFVFELSAYLFGFDDAHDLETLLTYCYYDEPKHVRRETAVQAAIRFYPSLYDRVAYSGTTRHVSFTEDVVFEIVDETGPLAMENVPINCWLSPQPAFGDSLNDRAETTFVENGCPARKGVIMDRKTDHRIKSDMGTRVRFTLDTFYREQKKFLYVHCQYVKCSNVSGETDSKMGQLPPCPWAHACAFNQPLLPFNESQLSSATSYAVLVTGRNKPREVHLPSANIPEGGASNDQRDCKGGGGGGRHSSNGGNGAASTEVNVSLSTVALYCFGAFVMGVALVGMIWYCECQYRQRNPVITKAYDHHQRLGKKKTSAAGTTTTVHVPRMFTALKQATPMIIPPPPRERHLAGFDGYEPPRPASSFDLSLSTAANVVAGGSTIVRNDEAWNLKHMNDSID